MAIGKQPFFKAPSVPKMGKKTVSSSVFSNVSQQVEQKFKISPFRFLQPKQQNIAAQTELLQTKVEQSTKNDGIINSTLTITNRVLDGVQKQLFSYFSSIEAEKKQALAASKASAQKRRIGAKEQGIEEPNKINQIIGKAFDKVTAPARSIFGKILEFFSILLTGILVNSAWKWLQDPKNREKVGKFFSFIAEHWRWIVRVLVLGKLLGFLYKVYRVVSGLKKGVDLLRKGWDLLNKTKKTSGPGGGGGGDPCRPLLQCMGNPAFSARFVAASIAAFIANQQLTNHIKNVAKGLLVPAPPTPIPAVPPVVPPTTQRPTLQQQYRQSRQGAPAGGYSATNVQAAQQAAGSTPAQSSQQLSKTWDQVRSLSNDPEIQAILKTSALLTFLDGPFPFGDPLAVGNLLRILPKLIQVMTRRGMAVAASKGGTIPKEAPKPKKKCDTCSLLPTFSQGGTVGGPGSGNVDSVPTMLAPGEEVIRTSAAMLFRPLLKDINDNAGRMWQAFQSAIDLQERNNFSQLSTTEKFNRLLDAFNKELKGLIQKEKVKELKNNSSLFGPGNIPAQEGTGKGGPSDIPPGDSRLNELIEPASKDSPLPSPTTPPSTPSPSPLPTNTQPPIKPTEESRQLQEPSTKPTPRIPTVFQPTPPQTPLEPVKPQLPFTIPVIPWKSQEQSFINVDQTVNKFVTAKSKQISPETFKKPVKKTNILPFQMPPINLAGNVQNNMKGSMPDPSSGSATDVPSISSFDSNNFYVSWTPYEYGMIT